MTAPRNARERARAELTREIIDAARRQLADVGAAALSLRAVARELGMVSSAVYRYFASRDELLTALLIDAYNSLGTQAEEADAQARQSGASAQQRWTAVWHSVRQWALTHRHEFTLLYGTPVPGYTAPAETTAAASRTPLALAGIVNDAAETGKLKPPVDTPIARTVINDRIWDLAVPQLQPQGLAALLMAWSHMIGTISFELFSHFEGVVTDNEAFYRHTAQTTGIQLGLPT